MGGNKDKERGWCPFISPPSQISICTSKLSVGTLLFLHLQKPLHLGSSWLLMLLCFLVVLPPICFNVLPTSPPLFIFSLSSLCSHHLPLCSSPYPMLPFTVNNQPSANRSSSATSLSGLFPLVLGVKGMYSYHVNKKHKTARNYSGKMVLGEDLPAALGHLSRHAFT